jgi:hypothetical protein
MTQLPAFFFGGVDANGGWNLDLPRLRAELLEAGKQRTPLLLLGTAFSFVHLLDALTGDSLQIALPEGSCVMETGGYKGRSRSLPRTELHALICNQLGVRIENILCEYGMSELSSQAYAVAGGMTGGAVSAPRIFRFPPWARSVVISPETGREVAEGETGLLRIFDLANAWSCLALQTEDLAIRRAKGFELLGRAVATEPRGCSLMQTDPVRQT